MNLCLKKRLCCLSLRANAQFDPLYSDRPPELAYDRTDRLRFSRFLLYIALDKGMLEGRNVPQVMFKNPTHPPW